MPRRDSLYRFVLICLLGIAAIGSYSQVKANERPLWYFAHKAVLDRYGVIAPWYTGQNGQLDERVRIAAETLKRYPWTPQGLAPVVAPYYAYNNTWRIAPDGKISIPTFGNWYNGGRGQASARVISALVKYYQYSGDPSAIAQITAVANALLSTCLTGSHYPWPDFLISVPVAGKPYGQCSDKGFIQLDIVAEAGVALLDAYQLTGDVRYFDAVKHWGDVFEEKRNRMANAAPWNRYANPERVPWGRIRDGRLQTGGVVYELAMMNDLLRLGYAGKNGGIAKARDAALAYLKNVLLPKWYVNDTWGRNYWDWQDPVQSQTTTDWVASYLMNHRNTFPNWRDDARNILTIFLNHTGVSRRSDGGVYSGAWAFPESDGCCGKSLAWGPMFLAADFAEYGEEADDKWATEVARRMQILATYDSLENGVAEDKIHGGTVEAGEWFNGTHPSALYYVLRTIGWMPQLMAPSRENHIVRSTSVVNYVYYGKGNVAFTTFDAPRDTRTVLRLAFKPSYVSANGRVMLREDQRHLAGNAYRLRPLSNGDYIVTIRHDGATKIVIRGPDPQDISDDAELTYRGSWTVKHDPRAYGGTEHITSQPGSTARFSFTGNQIRVLGAVGPQGGRAAIYLDGVRQLAGVDFWNPKRLDRQIVYYRSGLSQGPHTILIVSLNKRNPYSSGRQLDVDAIESSAATGSTGFGSGDGPTGTQRIIFGYTNRDDYVDSKGHPWRPGTEFVVRTGFLTDSVADTWNTMKQALTVYGTNDPELYSYGVHASDFKVDVTAGPGKYYVRLLFAETQPRTRHDRAINIYVNGKLRFRRFDVLATARSEELRRSSEAPKWKSAPDTVQPGSHGIPNPNPESGMFQAVDFVVNGVRPKNGIIQIRLQGARIAGTRCQAMLQAAEIGPGRREGRDVAVNAQ